MMSDNAGFRPSPLQSLAELHSAAPVILPSLLQCDFTCLADEIHTLELAGAPAFHLDVMDGHFVPNLTYGPLMVEAVRRVTELPLDAHLMISNPAKYVDAFVAAGADILTVHVEAVPDILPVLKQIRAAGAMAGLALNPPTPLEKIEPLLAECDMILVMSVMPGFGGQAFHSVALEKLYRLRKLVGPKMPLEVDGGVNQQTIKQCAEAGANLFVVGSAILGQSDYAGVIAELHHLAKIV
jgi:ribulose-phosphate 3-epimerase